MDKFEFLVFDGLNLDNYEVVETQIETLISDIEKVFGRKDGCTNTTSSWMNRFALFENEGKTFVIVPSTIPSYNNVVKATVGKYVLLLVCSDLDFQKFTSDDIQYFKDNMSKQFDFDLREKREKQACQDLARVAIRDTFRIPLYMCSDDTVEIIRYMLLNGKGRLFRALVLASVDGKADIVKGCYNILLQESDIKGITISAEEFAKEVIKFFSPEMQFAHIGVTPEEGLCVYFVLTVEGHWLRDAFLTMSEKKNREIFNDFMRKLEDGSPP